LSNQTIGFCGGDAATASSYKVDQTAGFIGSAGYSTITTSMEVYSGYVEPASVEVSCATFAFGRYNYVSFPVYPYPNDLSQIEDDVRRLRWGVNTPQPWNVLLYKYNGETWEKVTKIEPGVGYAFYRWPSGDNVTGDLDVKGYYSEVNKNRVVPTNGSYFTLLGNPGNKHLNYISDVFNPTNEDNLNTNFYYYDYDDKEWKIDHTNISPWQAFWVVVDTPSLIVNVKMEYNNQAPLSIPKKKKQSDFEWIVQVVFTGPNVIDSQNFVGIKPGSNNNKDPEDIRHFPPDYTEDLIEVYVVNDDWGDKSGKYTKDIKSPDNNHIAWKVEAYTNVKSGTVEITWPKVPSLGYFPPESWQLQIKDLLTGLTIDMRLQESYSYDIIDTATREFEIYATRLETPLPTPTGTPLPCILVGDFNCDGEVDYRDLFAMSESWYISESAFLSGFPSKMDINEDKVINNSDLMLFIREWHK